jgi:hypothetical protein
MVVVHVLTNAITGAKPIYETKTPFHTSERRAQLTHNHILWPTRQDVLDGVSELKLFQNSAKARRDTSVHGCTPFKEALDLPVASHFADQLLGDLGKVARLELLES